MVGLEEEGGADEGLAGAAGGVGVENGRLGLAEVGGGQVHLGLATVDAGDVDFDEELAAGQGSALAEPRLGHCGAGAGDPGEVLLFGEGAPALGDGGKEAADRDLAGGAWVERDEGGVADHAVACALPDILAPFSRHGVGQFHG